MGDATDMEHHTEEGSGENAAIKEEEAGGDATSREERPGVDALDTKEEPVGILLTKKNQGTTNHTWL